jgi:hypothetical protein
MRNVGTGRRMTTCICVLSLCVLGLGTARGAVIFSEDFETYSDAGFLDDDPNPNGWAYSGGSVYVGIPWSLDYTFTPNSTARTYLDGSNMVWEKKDGNTRSAIAALPAKNSGQLTLTYDMWYLVNDPKHAGIRIQDSTTGGYMNIFAAYGGCILDTSTDESSWFGDPGDYVYDVQSFTVTLDLDAGTVSAVVTCANPIYGGNTSSSSGTLNLPSGFVADRILLWNSNGGGWSDSCIGDNIVVDYVPEPATMGLLMAGGLGMLLRKRR